MGVLSLGCCRCFSCYAWHVPTCRTPPGEGGVARCKGGVSPPLEREPKAERKGRSVAEVCTSEARKIGETLATREGGALRKVWFPHLRWSERMNLVGRRYWQEEAVKRLPSPPPQQTSDDRPGSIENPRSAWLFSTFQRETSSANPPKKEVHL
jgi:hypothetical protein